MPGAKRGYWRYFWVRAVKAGVVLKEASQVLRESRRALSPGATAQHWKWLRDTGVDMDRPG